MAEIIWTNNALKDLAEIGEFIALDSLKYAQITIQKLYQKVEILVEHPQSGRIVPEVDQNSIRELIEGNYRIIYELKGQSVFILTVYHSSRILKL